MIRNDKTGYISISPQDPATLMFRGKGRVPMVMERTFGQCARLLEGYVEREGRNRNCGVEVMVEIGKGGRDIFTVVYGNELSTTYRLRCPGVAKGFGFYALYSCMGHYTPCDGKLYKTPEGAANAGLNFFCNSKKK